MQLVRGSSETRGVKDFVAWASFGLYDQSRGGAFAKSERRRRGTLNGVQRDGAGRMKEAPRTGRTRFRWRRHADHARFAARTRTISPPSRRHFSSKEIGVEHLMAICAHVHEPNIVNLIGVIIAMPETPRAVQQLVHEW